MQDRLNGLIDIHCHIIPGADDGARSMEEALELLRQAYGQGILTAAATPHYSRRSQDGTLHAAQESLCAELERRARAEIDPGFRILLGQETYWHEELPQRLRDGFAWPMGDSRYVLVEFDTGSDLGTILRGLRSLTGEGWIPILAHMERYPAIRADSGIPKLRALGTVLQMNYESLDGPLLSRETRWCRDRVRRGETDLLGTDMHRTDFRPPQIAGAMHWLERHTDGETLRRLTRDNAERIFRDEPIEYE